MTHTAKHKGPQKWDDYFSTKKDMWKERFASLKTLCKELKLKEFQFKFIHRIIGIMVSSRTTTVYIVANKTPLSILLATVLLLKNFHMRSLVGSMLRTKHTSIRPWKRNCSVFPLNNLKKV